MMLYNNKKVHARAKRLSFIICHLSFILALTGLSAACSDWRDGIPDAADDPAAMSFTGRVITSRPATRSDGSIVNLKETSLPASTPRTVYRYNPESGKVEAQTDTYYAGIFGCYTGQNKWEELEKIAQKSENNSRTEEEQSKLNEYYTANLFYNQKAEIAAASNGNNALSYSPLRFWPNNRLTSDATKTEYCTFWAYYPWNPTDDPGEYGVSITTSNVGTSMGMGSIKFTMHPDASQQNDFMVAEPVADCNRTSYPLVNDGSGGYAPTPVPFNFRHMLAQVRVYAFIRGTDRLVYTDEAYTADDETNGVKYYDEWGKERPVVAGQKKIDEEKSVRWKRTGFTDIKDEKYRADIHYKLEFNNIKTAAYFSPHYDTDGKFTGLQYTEATNLGKATVNHYIMNPYWFRFKTDDTKERYMLNENYMYRYFEDTPVYKREDASDTDGINWKSSTWNDKYTTGGALNPTTTPLHYLTGSDWTREKELGVPGEEIANATGPYFKKHYNYCPGNIIMAVPQVLEDDDVPHIVITATGTRTKWNGYGWEDAGTVTAKVTVNMLQMKLKWESGFIYSYAFIDELRPGDDIVRGPESITVIFDTSQWTDQW